MIDNDARQRLGAAIRTARTRARLSIERAAKQAGISPTTLGRIERGEDYDVRGQTYTAIEVTIGWTPGSVAQVLAGGDPTPVAGQAGNDRDAAVDHIAAWESGLITEIWARGDISDELKEELTARVRRQAAESRVIEDRLRRSAS